MLAIRDGRPETLNLKSILKASVDFQFDIVRRKYTNLLEKEQKRREIQEGLIKACNVIDLVIEILRGSKDRPMAKNCLVNGCTDGIAFRSRESKAMAAQLKFTEAQADAILDMRLYKLIGLELDALVREHEQTVANIYRYEDILENQESMTMVIQKDLRAIREEFKKPRKTGKSQWMFILSWTGLAMPERSMSPPMRETGRQWRAKTDGFSGRAVTRGCVCSQISDRCIPCAFRICPAGSCGIRESRWIMSAITSQQRRA